MIEPNREIIVAILCALSEGPKTLETLIRETSDANSSGDESAVLTALERLTHLEIVGTPPAVTPLEFELLVPFATLAPLLKTLGREPWRRLTNWRHKLAPESVTRSVAKLQAPAGQAEAPKPGYYVQEVFFATDRKTTVPHGDATFGPDRSPRGELKYGLCEVSIPDTHLLGNLESPSFLRFEFSADPAKHIVLLRTDIIDVNVFRNRLTSVNADILIFVHGYNVEFGDAVRRTAQIAFDLQYDGLAIAYSWPSGGALLDYMRDETNAEWSQPHFQNFLTDVSKWAGAGRINVIAHSMGNRLVARSVANLQDDDLSERLSTIVMAAPDIDRAVFIQLAKAVSLRARNVVLYASDHDRALRVSKLFHAYPRAGDSGDVVACDGIQTVDVSGLEADFTGHGYFCNDINVVSDLYYLLKGQLPRRFRLKHITAAGGEYWRFVP